MTAAETLTGISGMHRLAHNTQYSEDFAKEAHMASHARNRLIPLLVAALVCSSLSNQAFAQQTPDSQEVLIDQLLREIQVGLAKAQKDLAAEKIPPLQSVTLDLVAEAKVAVGGKINLYIVTFGAKWEKERTQQVEVTLKPPSPNLPMKVAKGPSVSDQLANAIVSAGKGVQAARNDKSVPLAASGLKVVLSFVVKGDTAGGTKFEIAPVTFDLSGRLANQAIQKITVVYQNPEQPKK